MSGLTVPRVPDNILQRLPRVEKSAGISRENLSEILADNSLTYSAGELESVTEGVTVRSQAEGFRYAVAASTATDHDLATAGGVKLKVIPGEDGYVSLDALSIDKTGGSNVAAAIADAVVKFGKVRGGEGAQYQIASNVSRQVAASKVVDFTGCVLDFDGGSLTFEAEPRQVTDMSAADDGDLIITLGSANVNVGDLIHITADTTVTNDHGGYPKHMVRRAIEVSGSDATLDAPLVFPILDEESGLVVTVYPAVSFALISPKITGSHGSTPIQLTGFSGARVDNPEVIREHPFNPSSDTSRRGIRLNNCHSTIVTSLYAERVSYPLIPSAGTRSTVVVAPRGVDCRHIVDPVTWADGVTIVGQTAIGCDSSINTHPAFNIHYTGARGFDELTLPNLRAIGGSIADCTINLRTDVTPSSGMNVHTTTVESDFLYLWGDAHVSVDNLTILQGGSPFGEVRVSNGSTVRVSGITAGSLAVANNVSDLFIGAGMNCRLKKFGGGTDGIRLPFVSAENPRIDAVYENDEYRVDIFERMVDQSGRHLRCYGLLIPEKVMGKESVRFVTSGFGALDNPSRVVGSIKLRCYIKHNSVGVFDLIEQTYGVLHKIVSASSVSVPTTPFAETDSPNANAVSLTLSAVTQEGRSEIAANSAFSIAFDLEPTISVSSPRMMITYEMELVAFDN